MAGTIHDGSFDVFGASADVFVVVDAHCAEVYEGLLVFFVEEAQQLLVFIFGELDARKNEQGYSYLFALGEGLTFLDEFSGFHNELSTAGLFPILIDPCRQFQLQLPNIFKSFLLIFFP
jgi:hypothetical protein